MPVTLQGLPLPTGGSLLAWAPQQGAREVGMRSLTSGLPSAIDEAGPLEAGAGVALEGE